MQLELFDGSTVHIDYIDAWVSDPQLVRLWRLVAERGIETVYL